MAALPCICSNPECGTIFFITGVGARTANEPGIVDIPEKLVGSLSMGNCPDCGEPGNVPAGRYEMDFKDNGTENPARLVAGPLSTQTIIQQARTLMAALKQNKTQKQAEVIATLETISPAIAGISRQTADKFTYKDWINLIIALLGLFIAIQQAYFKKEEKPADSSGIKPEYVEMLIKENSEIRAQQQAKAIAAKVRKPTKQQPTKTAVHPGRNQPCPCGSGKKFKKCHGA